MTGGVPGPVAAPGGRLGALETEAPPPPPHPSEKHRMSFCFWAARREPVGLRLAVWSLRFLPLRDVIAGTSHANWRRCESCENGESSTSKHFADFYLENCLDDGLRGHRGHRLLRDREPSRLPRTCFCSLGFWKATLGLMLLPSTLRSTWEPSFLEAELLHRDLGETLVSLIHRVR